MLDRIITHPELFGILRPTCEENDISVQVCEELLDNGELREDLIRILKVDKYYNSSRMHNPPPSLDCLIVIKTGDFEFGLTLIELKNVSSAKDLQPRKIRPKFDTTINDFLSKKFADIFMDSQFHISYFRLWLVTNPYQWPPLSAAI